MTTCPMTAGADPRRVVAAVVTALAVDGIRPDLLEADLHTAYVSAAALLLALGVTPDTTEDDDHPGARIVRDIMLEAATRTTTRPRRAV